MISQITLEQNTFLISGPMTFSTVYALWKSSQQIFPRQASWRCDFSKVSACDSAGVALLLEWLKFAKAQKKEIQFLKIPQQLCSIASSAGLDKLLQPFIQL